MSNEIVKPPSAELEALVASAAYYGKSTIADSTLALYKSNWGIFERWCAKIGLPSMPPAVETVAIYLAALADGNVEAVWTDRHGFERRSQKPHKYGLIQHHYAAILYFVRKAGHEWAHAIPAITKVMHGIRYRNGDKKDRKAPLELADLRACLAKMNERRYEDLGVIRDRAILSLGFFSAMRGSEIVGLRVEDLAFTKDGLLVTIRKSKTDQFSEGETLGIHAQKDPKICPVVLLKRYLEVSELKTGPLFRRIDYRSDCMGDKPLLRPAVARVVKAACERVGLAPERFSGHSLRAGFVTSAAAKGVTLHNIMRQTRHKDQRVAMTYIRPATVFKDNATAGLGDEEPEGDDR